MNIDDDSSHLAPVETDSEGEKIEAEDSIEIVSPQPTTKTSASGQLSKSRQRKERIKRLQPLKIEHSLRLLGLSDSPVMMRKPRQDSDESRRSCDTQHGAGDCNREITAINTLHNANPGFTSEGDTIRSTAYTTTITPTPVSGTCCPQFRPVVVRPPSEDGATLSSPPTASSSSSSQTSSSPSSPSTSPSSDILQMHHLPATKLVHRSNHSASREEGR